MSDGDCALLPQTSRSQSGGRPIARKTVGCSASSIVHSRTAAVAKAELLTNNTQASVLSSSGFR